MTSEDEIEADLDIPEFLRRQRAIYPTASEMANSLRNASKRMRGIGMEQKRKHGHYYKDVRAYNDIDVYRVLGLFGVTDPCIGHAIKKLLVAGGRGAGKDLRKDINEAIDSLVRCREMIDEDEKPTVFKEQG